jgi:hypothetical protein
MPEYREQLTWRHAITVPLCFFIAYGLWSLPNLLLHWHVYNFAIPFSLTWLAIAVAPIQLARQGRKILAVAVAILGIVALRISIGYVVAGHVPAGDAHMYLLLAEDLRAGRGLEVFEPFMGTETRALFPPLYPIVLTAWSFVAGLSTASLIILGILTDALAAMVIVTLASALGNRRAGLVAAWLYLIWPSTLLSAPLAQKEGFCALLVLVLALQWVRYAQVARPGMREAAAIGVTAGLLALTQPGELPLAGLFGLVALGCDKKRLLLTSLTALPTAMAAVMLPWWVRNLAVFGSFVPLTSAGGYGLWVGNNPNADGHWMPPPHALYGLPEIAFGHAAARLAMGWIAAHPLDFVKVTVAKALRGWGIAEFGVSRLADLKPATDAGISGSLFVLAQALHVSVLFIAALRTSILRVPGSRPLLVLVLACLIQTLCFGAFFEFGERHREFATPFLLLLAMWGVKDPHATKRKRSTVSG